MRNISFVNGEYYHIFNRGTDKRNIVSDNHDVLRFTQSLCEFNCKEPIGSMYENSFKKEVKGKSEKKKVLVDIICYCLNPNHYHLLLRQRTDSGISDFMHRLGMGYSKYFNEKNKRSGSLFQGTFKAVHIESNEQLLHVSSYINLNYKVHGINKMELKCSSWDEYVNRPKPKNICKKNIILGQFKTRDDYKKFSESTVAEIKRRRADLEDILIE
jgi:putative transposase